MTKLRFYQKDGDDSRSASDESRRCMKLDAGYGFFNSAEHSGLYTRGKVIYTRKTDHSIDKVVRWMSRR